MFLQRWASQVSTVVYGYGLTEEGDRSDCSQEDQTVIAINRNYHIEGSLLIM